MDRGSDVEDTVEDGEDSCPDRGDAEQAGQGSGDGFGQPAVGGDDDSHRGGEAEHRPADAGVGPSADRQRAHIGSQEQRERDRYDRGAPAGEPRSVGIRAAGEIDDRADDDDEAGGDA